MSKQEEIARQINDKRNRLLGNIKRYELMSMMLVFVFAFIILNGWLFTGGVLVIVGELCIAVLYALSFWRIRTNIKMYKELDNINWL